MAYNRWAVTLVGQDALLIKMQNYSSQSEAVINKVLKETGGQVAVDKITNLIPISNEDLRRGHRHARSSKPLNVQYFNLGFRVRPKKSFEYIKYPDLGIGTSQRNMPQDFMQRGLEIAVDPITAELIKGFDELNSK
ncbi:hypothetical protein ACVN9X_03145 [Enterococcus dispar]|uniref:HK97 gp10 family phage protein n=1 Tax=Enterococcus dispar ATCC 51266 TaxID=1139219 RepID=S0KTQ4_9ENTE|nr:hypothetical protein [Enterococcus dispar]EOT42601.1 hypothetical protein OMK_00962 [Enterococcus dispar ATCC 51266]EOW84948.1 hypothetical protein I569_00237 [Enterococcus dispar ATCC 51266]OJG37663.1 hypothetical protein RV01_GL001221 [Enterococcus dispar]